PYLRFGKPDVFRVNVTAQTHLWGLGRQPPNLCGWCGRYGGASYSGLPKGDFFFRVKPTTTFTFLRAAKSE
ncbi:hypothetical protein PIB30_101836, partial [Stylosanthes scabra]|nr:hypothetical protein [Stylosanthes scabra]